MTWTPIRTTPTTQPGMPKKNRIWGYSAMKTSSHQQPELVRRRRALL